MTSGIQKNRKTRQNIFCYVDETGQDTLGRLFVVSVLIVTTDRDALIAELEKIERLSGKGNAKWIHTRSGTRVAYIEAMLSNKKFNDILFFSVYTNVKSYMALTILSTAKAVLATAKPTSVSTVYVDGLPKAHVRKFGSDLRKLNIQTRKVLGIRREESNALLRLADACCGFVRLALFEREESFMGLFRMARAAGYLKEV
jgi:hypothetical protein